MGYFTHSRNLIFVVLPLILVVTTPMGCAGPQQKMAAGSALTMEMLGNAEYPSEWTAAGNAELTSGVYRETILEGSASEITILLTDKIAFGRLNEAMEVAAVILHTQTGGSGTFIDLAVVIDREGRLETIGSRFLGDRVRVQDISIESGEIVLSMITHGSGDPMCCPTLEVTQTYKLYGDRLVQTHVEN